VDRVLVIGDSCIDIFEYGKCKRISPEAPVPILIPFEEKQNSGMTLNVYANLLALGIDCDVLTNSDKPIKKRYIEENSNHMLLRVDRNDIVKPLDWEYLKYIEWRNYNAIVISDYDKGFLDKEQIRYIGENGSIVFMDSKKQLGEWCDNINFIKVNDKESQENWNYLHDEFPNDVIITLGKQGATLNYTKKFSLDIIEEHPVRDLSGAGDTFLAGFVVGYLKNSNIEEAINFANKCAAWVVTQRGVTIIDPTKI
jgi:D-beta-D-heptose 7-phosphate kinase/D-beta-D-heptose 1-phosphate adenosyltransferase